MKIEVLRKINKLLFNWKLIELNSVFKYCLISYEKVFFNIVIF